MKIGIYSPIQEIVPPPKYGGTELIVSYLVEELVKRGNDVTLFARSESKTQAKLVSLGIDEEVVSVMEDRYIATYELALELAKMSKNFDLIHVHAGWRFLPFVPIIKAPTLMTYHGVFYEKFHPIFSYYNQVGYTSISNDQQQKAPKDLKFLDTVYNGIDIAQYHFIQKPDDYMLWVGRIVEKKGVDLAIQVAQRLDKKLIIAGNFVDDRPEDQEYRKKIESFIDNDRISYIGPVGGQEKYNLFANAHVFLNPIIWDEPFGLVVPEANAGGTPVVSFNRGAMSEIINDGENGFLCSAGDIDEFTLAVERIYQMSDDHYSSMRRNSRKFVENNFTIKKMVDGYESVYQKVIQDYKKENG